MKLLVLNGSSKAIALSVVVHLIIVYLLSSTISVTPYIPHTVQRPIESYLYVPPPEQQPELDNEPEKVVTEKQQPKPDPEPAPELELESPTQEQMVEADTSIDKPNIATTNMTQPEKNVSTDDPPISSDRKKFSAAASMEQLRALNDNLEDDMFEQIFVDKTKPNTGSKMHGEPMTVPHSVQPKTEEEKKTMATQQMGGGFAITKGENGSCTITRDLSHVGMEGLTSVEGFRCGPTEIQKAFNAHMKKWQKKYGKLKKPASSNK